MKVGFIVLFVLTTLFFSGCSKRIDLDLFKYQTKISTKEINKALAKIFPIREKTSFGFIVLKQAIFVPSENIDKLSISLSFKLTNFEVPEGVDGTIMILSNLRYDSYTNKIYLKDITPMKIQLADISLEKYISATIKSYLKVMTMRYLSDAELYQISKSFTAKFIKNITFNKGNILIKYGI